MREAEGDLFEYPADAIVIPVNWTTKRDGTAVMGAGVAKQAAERWPWLPTRLGGTIRFAGGPHIRAYPVLAEQHGNRWVVAFPTKTDWRAPSDLELIEGLLTSLLRHAEHWGWQTIALPRLGCGHGGLSWDDVRPVLARCLDDRFVVVSPLVRRRDDADGPATVAREVGE